MQFRAEFGISTSKSQIAISSRVDCTCTLRKQTQWSSRKAIPNRYLNINININVTQQGPLLCVHMSYDAYLTLSLYVKKICTYKLKITANYCSNTKTEIVYGVMQAISQLARLSM